MARKHVDLLPERPMFVVALESRRWRWSSGGQKHQALAQAVLDATAHLLPGDLLVVPLNGNIKWLYKKMKKVAGARVHPRN